MPAKVSKNQRVGAGAAVVRGVSAFDGKPCGVCGAKTRRKYPVGRTTSSRWRKCENGHTLYRKNK